MSRGAGVNEGVVGKTAVVCLLAAVATFAIAAPLGHWQAGLALAVGLAIGAANGFLVRRSLGSAAGFRASSLGRLALLSVVGLGAGLLISPAVAPLVLVGVAVAQIALTLVAGWELSRA